MLRIDKIANLNNKAQELYKEVNQIKVLLISTESVVEAIDSKMDNSFIKLQESNRELKNKLEHLKRYSCDFNIHLIGVEEEEGEDCMLLFQTTSHFLALKKLMEN